MQDKNFIEIAIENGFMPTKMYQPFNYYNNWFGVSVYHPDLELVKGSKSILLSLQGLAAFLYMNYEEHKENDVLINNRAVKFIGLLEDGKIVYKSFSGVVPSHELMQKFIND